MTYIHHVNGFYSQLQKERRLNAYHISLYMALFESWNRHRFQNPFPLYRDRLMQLSGIGSRNTYSKCLKELHLNESVPHRGGVAHIKPASIIQHHRLPFYGLLFPFLFLLKEAQEALADQAVWADPLQAASILYCA